MPIKRRLQSFQYAFQGVFHLFATQPNARIHGIAAILVTAAGWYFNLHHLEWALLFLSIGMVVAAEACNTAIEELTNLVSPEIRPQAGRVKDVAAAAVLLSACAAALVGLVIFAPRLYTLFW
jgi:diacylglycerol kinase